MKTNKNDVADAQAIWTAAQQPEMRAVAVKTEEQQAVLALHAIRERLKKARTAAINQLHGLMGEFGVELPKGWRTMLPRAAAAGNLEYSSGDRHRSDRYDTGHERRPWRQSHFGG